MLSRDGSKALRSEYTPGVRWAVLDFGDLIVHFFEKKTREYYSLERLWGDARIESLNPRDYIDVDSLDLEEEDEDI